jgi:hypothetical protein
MNGGCPVIDCLAENCLKSGCGDCLDECEGVNCAAVDVECMSEGLVCRCVCGGIAPITFEGENVYIFKVEQIRVFQEMQIDCVWVVWETKPSNQLCPP